MRCLAAAVLALVAAGCSAMSEAVGSEGLDRVLASVEVSVYSGVSEDAHNSDRGVEHFGGRVAFRPLAAFEPPREYRMVDPQPLRLAPETLLALSTMTRPTVDAQPVARPPSDGGAGSGIPLWGTLPPELRVIMLWVLAPLLVVVGAFVIMKRAGMFERRDARRDIARAERSGRFPLSPDRTEPEPDDTVPPELP